MTGPSVVRRTGQTWFLTGCWTMFAVIAALTLAQPSESPLASTLILVPILIGGLVLAVRTLRAEIRIEAGGLLLRGMLRTRRLAWQDVDRAEVHPTNEFRLFYLLTVRQADGSVVKVDGLANFGLRRDPDHLPVGRMATAINRRVEHNP